MTDLPSQPTIELMLQTTIPRVLDVTPLVLYWKQGEKLAPKTAEIDLAPDLPFQKLEVGDAGPNFQVALNEIQHAAHYELVVTPMPAKPAGAAPPTGNATTPDAAGPIARAQITLTLHLTGDQTRTSNVFAFIFSDTPAPLKLN